MDRVHDTPSGPTRRSVLKVAGATATVGTVGTPPSVEALSLSGTVRTGDDVGWSAYRGSSRRAGFNSGTTGPVDDFELAWVRDVDATPAETPGLGLEYEHDGSARFAPPAVDDERVYLATPDGVYCLDLLTGGQAWQTDIEHPVVTQPAVDDGRVYVGTNRDTGPPDYETIGELVALDRTDGSVVWRTEPRELGDIDPQLSCGPVAADGAVYAGTMPSTETYHRGAIISVAAETGEKRWAGTAEVQPRSLAVEGDWVTVTTSDQYSPTVFTIEDRGDTFSNAWSWEAGPFKTPALRDGTAYYTRDSSYHVLAAESGDVVRESANAAHEFYGEGQSPPVIGPDRVYRFMWGSDEAPPRILALNGRTGDVVWRTDLDPGDDPAPGQLTAAAGVLYLTSPTGDATTVRAFDPETGDPLGERRIDAPAGPAVPAGPGRLVTVEYVDRDEGFVPRVRVLDGTQSERPRVTDADVTRRWCRARATAATLGNDLEAGDSRSALVEKLNAARDDSGLTNAGRAELLDRLDWGAGVTLQAHRLLGRPPDGAALAPPPGECDPGGLRRLEFPSGGVDLIETTVRTVVAMLQEIGALYSLLQEAADEVETGESLLRGASREVDSLQSYIDDVVLAGRDTVFGALWERRDTIRDQAVGTFVDAEDAPEPVQEYQTTLDGLVDRFRDGVREALIADPSEDLDRVVDGLGPGAVGSGGPTAGYSGAGIAFQHGYDSMTATATIAQSVMESVLTVLGSGDFISAVVELHSYLQGDDLDPLALFGLVEPLLGLYTQIAKVVVAAAASAIGGLALQDVLQHKNRAVRGVLEGRPQ